MNQRFKFANQAQFCTTINKISLMKTANRFYNPAVPKEEKSTGINITSLFSWLAVLFVIVLFWTGAVIAYERDYVPHAIANIEHQEKKFLDTHKTLQKKRSVSVTTFHS